MNLYFRPFFDVPKWLPGFRRNCNCRQLVKSLKPFESPFSKRCGGAMWDEISMERKLDTRGNEWWRCTVTSSNFSCSNYRKIPIVVMRSHCYQNWLYFYTEEYSNIAFRITVLRGDAKFVWVFSATSDRWVVNSYYYRTM